MNVKTFIASAILGSVLFTGAAFAASTTTATSTATPAKPAVTATTTVKPAETTATKMATAPAANTNTKPATPAAGSKEAISKACSVQADAQNLHGKDREKFRSECKKNGGKA